MLPYEFTFTVESDEQPNPAEPHKTAVLIVEATAWFCNRPEESHVTIDYVENYENGEVLVWPGTNAFENLPDADKIAIMRAANKLLDEALVERFDDALRATQDNYWD